MNFFQQIENSKMYLIFFFHCKIEFYFQNQWKIREILSILQTPSRIFNCLGKVVSSIKLIVLLLCNTGSVITLSISLNLFKVVEDGYEFFAKRQLVTLFSAPNYCGEFDNAGGMMSVDETLMCSFQVTILFPFHELKCFKLVFIHRYWSLAKRKPSTNIKAWIRPAPLLPVDLPEYQAWKGSKLRSTL